MSHFDHNVLDEKGKCRGVAWNPSAGGVTWARHHGDFGDTRIAKNSIDEIRKRRLEIALKDCGYLLYVGYLLTQNGNRWVGEKSQKSRGSNLLPPFPSPQDKHGTILPLAERHEEIRY